MEPAQSSMVATAGFPLGGRGYAILVNAFPTHDFQSVKAYKPSSIPGQSGSPIVNQDGEVTHVVTLRAKVLREFVGGALPISDWTHPDLQTVGRNGPEPFGPFTPLYNPDGF